MGFLSWLFAPCGSPIQPGASFCTNCGTPTSPPQPPPQTTTPPQQPQPYLPPVQPYERKSEGVAAVLSVVFAGLGQIYLGRIGRGLLILLGAVLIGIASFLLLFIPLLIFWVWNIYDAYDQARRYNYALATTGRPPW